MKKLLILDTFNFLHRAYHALPKTFRDVNGEATNAVYGVTSMVINVLDQIRPQYICAAVDSIEPTFRVEDFTGYKAHRSPMEDDLASQIPKVFEILTSFGIKQITANGYEADDVVATLVSKLKDQVEVIIVSNDRDLWQLLQQNVMVMSPSTKGDSEWVGAKEVIARMGFGPEHITDYKGLRGDPSDNIPGVHGIGEKTAKELIAQLGTIENIYNNIDKVASNSVREKLLNNYEQAIMSKKLATLIHDVPFNITLEELRYSDFNKLDVKKLLERYNFKSLIRRLGFEDGANSGKKLSGRGEVSSAQQSLF